MILRCFFALAMSVSTAFACPVKALEAVGSGLHFVPSDKSEGKGFEKITIAVPLKHEGLTVTDAVAIPKSRHVALELAGQEGKKVVLVDLENHQRITLPGEVEKLLGVTTEGQVATLDAGSGQNVTYWDWRGGVAPVRSMSLMASRPKGSREPWIVSGPITATVSTSPALTISKLAVVDALRGISLLSGELSGRITELPPATVCFSNYLSQDGKLAAAARMEWGAKSFQGLLVWNTFASATATHTLKTSELPHSVTISPSGKTVFFLEGEGLYSWRIEENSPTRIARFSEPAKQVLLLANSAKLVALTQNNELNIYSAFSGEHEGKLTTRLPGPVNFIRGATDGTSLIVAGENGSLVVDTRPVTLK